MYDQQITETKNI